MIKPDDFESRVIRPTLKRLAAFDSRLYTEASVVLLMGTAAQESDFGYYMDQIGGGPGLGPFSVEAATNESLWRHYLSKPSKALLREIVLGMVPESSQISRSDAGFDYISVDPEQLATNLIYSTAMARIKYWPKKGAIPSENDILAMGEYWDKHYNVNAEYGTPKEFVESFEKFLSTWEKQDEEITRL